MTRPRTRPFNSLGTPSGQALGGSGSHGDRLRVLFVLGEFPSVSETFVLDQITGLIERGMDVAVLARPPRGPAPEHGAVARYALRARTRYYPDTLRWRWRFAAELASWFVTAPTQSLRALGLCARFDRYGLDGLALGPLGRAAAARHPTGGRHPRAFWTERSQSAGLA